ncbi:MAG: hypothetical protein LAP39_07145 [Acidobacteriia bacterium]|nr:hypothetical protein [Terriglobia bacterium]
MPPIIKTSRMTCVWTVFLLMPFASTAQNGALHITVVSGEDAVHSPGAHITKPITIEVTDAAGRPVEGARASFQLPEEGPGGMLSNGLRTDLATTDTHGRATLRGFQLNRIPGPFNVRITAATDQARAGIVVRQRIGEANATSGSADRNAQPPAPTATNVAPVKATPPATAPPKVTPDAARPTRAATPRAIEARVRPSPANPGPVAQTASDAAPSRPARTQTIIITQKSPKSTAGQMATSSHKSHKKWVWLGMMAAGGAAGAFARSSMSGAAGAHGSGSAAGITSSISIGTPTLTIGKP